MASQCSSFRAKSAACALTALALTFAAHADVTFQDVINPADPTFNQELGINNSGLIAGYFGSGQAGHPNKGYTLPYSTANPITSGFVNENFPGSAQTQVTGLNNIGTTVGFFSDTNNGPGLDNNFGWVNVGGVFTEANNPNASPVAGLFTDQLLGVNNSDIAAGFYVADDGTTHGYTYNIGTKTFSGPIDDPNGVGATTVAAINNSGELAGFFTNSLTGATEGFLENGGTFTTINVPGFTTTVLLGLNNIGQAVGFDMDAAGNMHGILCNTSTLFCAQIDDPNGVNTTTFNGLNDKGQIVGFYANGAGNTIGMVATVPEPSMFLLTGCGALLIGFLRRRRRA
ncbi:MAG TPA: PEP-CTERM sorting domain-containing protein [Bryobacteraceae bacterium]|jgi:hypothetical protein